MEPQSNDETTEASLRFHALLELLQRGGPSSCKNDTRRDQDKRAEDHTDNPNWWPSTAICLLPPEFVSGNIGQLPYKYRVLQKAESHTSILARRWRQDDYTILSLLLHDAADLRLQKLKKLRLFCNPLHLLFQKRVSVYKQDMYCNLRSVYFIYLWLKTAFLERKCCLPNIFSTEKYVCTYLDFGEVYVSSVTIF